AHGPPLDGDALDRHVEALVERDEGAVVPIGAGAGGDEQSCDRRTGGLLLRAHDSRILLASVRSLMRFAASSVAPPWSGWAARRASRKRRCTCLRSGMSASGALPPVTPRMPRVCNAQRTGSS